MVLFLMISKSQFHLFENIIESDGQVATQSWHDVQHQLSIEYFSLIILIAPSGHIALQLSHFTHVSVIVKLLLIRIL